jgi:hypothetical protein
MSPGQAVQWENCSVGLRQSEGWLLQANHLLHNGMSTDQYIDLKDAISIVEKEPGGSTMTTGYGNLFKVCAAQQRARNTQLIEVSAFTNLATTAVGDGGSGNGGDGGGSEATAAILPTAGGVGGDRGRI